ncbi:MAG TPA: hypothetical protein VKV04_06950 [Verrucomicrobiae bacterium]|nr:hypothetical protein [Verrucomicrobiae bacterium]
MKRFAMPFAFSLCVLFSCSRKQHSTEAERLDWNKETLVTAYEHFGNKDPKWDLPATNALMEFVRIRSEKSDRAGTDVQSELIGNDSEDAVKSGCNDPMVMYLYCRFNSGRSSRPLSFWQDEYRKMAQALENSSYPPLRKFYANDRAAIVLWENYDKTLWTEVTQFRRAAMNDLANAVQDKSLPIEEVSDACDLLLNTVSSNAKELPDAYKMLEPALFRNWPHAATAYFIKGRFYYSFAWSARGGGYADKVSTDGWKSFAEDLAVAEKAYREAWALNPKDPRIATEMIEMAVSQQKSRDEMELWFGRAMQLDTNNYAACKYKLRFLNPKWYGDRDQMLQFGRECVASTNWCGSVPLILVDAHIAYADLLESRDRAEYWLQPDVWPDVRSAYEKFIQVDPDGAVNDRYYYARYAFICGQWQEFKDQIKLIRDSDKGFNPAFFGGEEQFNKMMAQADAGGARAADN